MDLSNLKPAKGATRKRKRIARGVGSGYGGHSSTKGDKGQKSRSGASIPAWFEGGQMPLQRRVPKYGFKNRFRKEYRGINLASLAKLAESGDDINPATLVESGLAKKGERIKILGMGDYKAKVAVSAHAFSKSAREKIEKAGGSVEVVPEKSE